MPVLSIRLSPVPDANPSSPDDPRIQIHWSCNLPGEPFELWHESVLRSDLRKQRTRLALGYGDLWGVDLLRKPKPTCMNAASFRLFSAIYEARKIGRELFDEAQRQAIAGLLMRLPDETTEIHIEAEECDMFAIDLIPLEMLHYTDEEHVAGRRRGEWNKLGDLLQTLPGWKWPVIRRWKNLPVPLPTPLPRKGKARLAFIGDDANPSSEKDGLSVFMRQAHERLIATVGANDADYIVERHWPEQGLCDADHLLEGISLHLAEPAFMPGGCHYPDHPAAVTHFFCHADLDDAGGGAGINHAFFLGQDIDLMRHHPIRVDALQSRLEARKPTSHDTGRTLVFLCMCSCCVQGHCDDRSIASVFSAHGSPAVIGTESTMSTGAAQEMGVGFYRNFAQGREAAHIALWMAKREILKDPVKSGCLLPSVILYSCYGIPTCRLSQGTA